MRRIVITIVMKTRKSSGDECWQDLMPRVVNGSWRYVFLLT